MQVVNENTITRTLNTMQGHLKVACKKQDNREVEMEKKEKETM